jgi:flagellar M-ring protein FliF
MRTDRPDHPPETGGWGLAWSDRVWRWLAARDGPARRRIAFVALAVALAAIYLLATAESSLPTTRWLEGGRAFSDDEARILDQALAVRKIVLQRGTKGQLGVGSSEDLAVATKTLDDLGLTRRSFEQLIDQPASISPWADPVDRKQLLLRRRERAIEALLEGFDELLSVTVRLHESDAGHSRSKSTLNASVILRPRDNLAITPDLIERVQNILTSLERDLRRDRDISVTDDLGHAYLAADDPNVARRTLAEAQAHEWESAINDRLTSIVAGARVSVCLEWPLSPVESPPTTRTSPEVVANAPASLPEPVRREEFPAKANVLVEIPSRHFLDLFRNVAGSDRIPRSDDLEPLIQQTREVIEAAVHHVIPKESLGRFELVRIPLPVNQVPAVATSRPSRVDLRPWWAGAAALAGVILTLAATAGTRRLSSARRIASESPSPNDLRFDGEDRAGPINRVRELIRRDPEAAAGVLRRWAGQGGPSR